MYFTLYFDTLEEAQERYDNQCSVSEVIYPPHEVINVEIDVMGNRKETIQYSVDGKTRSLD